MNETGKVVLKTAGTSVLGGACGAGLYCTIGGVGLTAVGTGVGITLAPFVVIGASFGATGYGLVWLGRKLEKRRASDPPAYLTDEQK